MSRPGDEIPFRRSDRPIDQARLRAALRLAFDPAEADRIAARASSTESATSGYGAAAEAAGRALLQAALLARIGRGPAADPERPFPDPGRTSRAALPLLFHLGMNLDGDTLASVFGRPPDDLGDDLLAARRAIDASCPFPCKRFAASIGRYRDPRLDPEDRLGLLGHSTGCENCRLTLEFIRTLDADLLAEIDCIEGGLAPLPATARRQRRTRWLVPLAAVLVVVLTVAGLAALLDRATTGDTPAVALAAAPAPGYQGWLIGVAPGGRVEAYNLSTAETRVLRKGNGNIYPVADASPDGQIIAIWDPDQSPSDVGNASIEFVNLAGERVSVYAWDSSEWSQYFGGWLDSDTLLVVAVPATPASLTGESSRAQDEYQRRVREESRLLAVSAQTGDFRQLLVGNVISATPSPDGTMVAVGSTDDSNQLGYTLTLYPITGSGDLGDPWAKVENRVRSGAVWSPDSQMVVFARVTDAEVERIASSGRGPGPSQVSSATVELTGIDRAGLSRVLTPPGALYDSFPIAVTPGADSVLYFAGTSQSSPPIPMWLDVPGATERPFLPDQGASFYSNPVWSPDGTTLLAQVWRESYVAADATDRLDGPGGLSLVAVDPDGTTHAVATELVGFAAFVVDWLPEDALPPRAGPTLPGSDPRFTDPEPVGGNIDMDILASGSAVDASGSWLALYDPALGVPEILDLDDTSIHRLPHDLVQPRFSGGGRELLAAVQPSESGSVGSRIASISYAVDLYSGYGEQYVTAFDPALIGAEQSRRYASPELSPDGNALAFFVLNPETRIGEIWLAGWERHPAPIARWKIPPDALLDLDALGLWVDRSTFVYAEPSSWKAGLPTRIELMRVSLTDPANPVVDRVASVAARGSDRGIALREIALSPDRSQVAWRVRHYREPAADRGRVDSIEVFPVNDVNDRFEIARANPGNGLAWSPDGRWIAAALDRRIALLSPDGLAADYLTPTGASAEYPTWTGDGALWFNLDQGDGRRLTHVRPR